MSWPGGEVLLFLVGKTQKEGSYVLVLEAIRSPAVEIQGLGLDGHGHNNDGASLIWASAEGIFGYISRSQSPISAS